MKSTVNYLDSWYNNDQFRLKLKPECCNHQDAGKPTWSTAWVQLHADLLGRLRPLSQI